MSPSSGYKILLDGYNVILRKPNLFSASLESARRELIGRVSIIRWPMPVDCIKIVFDAKACEPSLQRPSGSVAVSFVPDADREIQRELRLIKPRQPYLLISDDAELRSTAKSHGALAHSVSWFMQLSSVGVTKPRRAIGEGHKERVSAVAARKITQELAARWLSKGK